MFGGFCRKPLNLWYKYPSVRTFFFSCEKIDAGVEMLTLLLFSCLVLLVSTDARDFYQDALGNIKPVVPSRTNPDYRYRNLPKRLIPILRQNQNIDPDGTYGWEYLTGNGIYAKERGGLRFQKSGTRSLSVQGSFSYISPEGIPISLTYVADENGFQPRGNHLPTPPPIPPAILKSLEFNALEEQEQGNSENTDDIFP